LFPAREDVLLNAAAQFIKERKLELHIIGDGPERAELEMLTDRFGIRSSVHYD
jgi:hypothetical protein